LRELDLRVGIITNEYPPFIFGGIGTFTQNLSQSLAGQGVDVVVIAGYPNKHPVRVFDKTRRLEILWLPRGPLAPRHLWFQLKNIDLIAREVSKCDVVHGQDSSAFPLLQLCKKSGLKVPWAITFHTNPHAQLYYAIKSVGRGTSLTDLTTYLAGFPLWDLTVRQHLKHADGLVCVSNSLRKELSKGYGFDFGRLTAIHTCVNTNELRTYSTSNFQRRSKDRVRLFYAGRLYYSKGVLHLVRILANLIEERDIRNFNLRIFGRGPLERVLRKYVALYSLRGNVAIGGQVDHQVLLRELTMSDIVCFPSLYEACPVLMIEAMSLGKPVVAFDLPFAREMLGNNEELLAKGINDFSKKLARLIISGDERTSLSRKMLERSEEFDAQKIATEYQKVYNQLI
jgi:glycosyltransferase involved in cell wall biosynthesis